MGEREHESPAGLVDVGSQALAQSPPPEENPIEDPQGGEGEEERSASGAGGGGDEPVERDGKGRFTKEGARVAALRARSKEPTATAPSVDAFLDRAKRAIDGLSQKALADMVSKNPAAFMRLVEWRQAIEAAPPTTGDGAGAEGGAPSAADRERVMEMLRGLRDAEPAPAGDGQDEESERDAPPLPPAR